MVARILVVDSDEAAVDMLETALRNADLEPVSALDQVTAIKLFDELSPAVVLIGVRAYGIDARGLAHALRARSAEVPLLFMGHGALGDPIRAPSEALDAGGDYYFRLPTDLAYLAGRVKGWAQNGAVDSSAPDNQHDELYALSAELDGDLDLEGLHVQRAAAAPEPENPALAALRAIAEAAEINEASEPLTPPTPPEVRTEALTESLSSGQALSFPARGGARSEAVDRPPPPPAPPSVDTARALVREAESLRSAGRIDDAIEAYETAASMYAQDGEVRPALALYKLLLYLDPTRLEMAFQGAVFAARHGESGDARALIERSARALEEEERLPDALDLVLRFIEQAGPNPQLMTLRRRLEAALPMSEEPWGDRLDEAVAEQRQLLQHASGMANPAAAATTPQPNGWGGSLDLLGLEGRPSDDLYPDTSELNRPATRDIAALAASFDEATPFLADHEKTVFTPDFEPTPFTSLEGEPATELPGDASAPPLVLDVGKTQFTPDSMPIEAQPAGAPPAPLPPFPSSEGSLSPVALAAPPPVLAGASGERFAFQEAAPPSPPAIGELEAAHTELAAFRDAPKSTTDLLVADSVSARPPSGRHRRPRARHASSRNLARPADLEAGGQAWLDDREAGLPVIKVARAPDASAFEFPTADTVPKTRPAEKVPAGPASAVITPAPFFEPDPDQVHASADFGSVSDSNNAPGTPARVQAWLPPEIDETDPASESKTEEVDISGIPELVALRDEAQFLTEEIPLEDEEAMALGRAIGSPAVMGNTSNGDALPSLPSPLHAPVDPPPMAQSGQAIDRLTSEPSSPLAQTPVPLTRPVRPLDPTQFTPETFAAPTQDIFPVENAAPLVPAPLPPRAPTFTQGSVTDLRESLEVLGELLAIRANGVLRGAKVQLVIADGQPAALRGAQACRNLIAEAQKGRPVPLESLPEGLDSAGSPAALARHLVAEGVMSGPESAALLHNQLETALRTWLNLTGPWQFTASEVFREELLSSLPDVRRTVIDLLVASSVSIDSALIIRSGTLDPKLLDRRDARFAALLDGQHAVGEAARLAGLPPARAAAVATVLLGFRLAVAVGRARTHRMPSIPAASAPVAKVPPRSASRVPPSNPTRAVPPPPPPAPSLSGPVQANPARAAPAEAGPPLRRALNGKARIRPHDALRTLPALARLRALAEMVRTSDYFTMLGVDENASWQDVDEAHRRLRGMVPTLQEAPEPSGPPLAREVIRSIDEARDVLKIPELRAAYLRHLRR